MSPHFKISTFLAVATALALVACAGPTPYQPRQNGQGYSDQKLEPDHYRVSFVGNTDTPRDTVENYLLYRAAEITLHEGKDYFVISDKNTVAHTTESGPNIGGMFGQGWGPDGDSTFTGMTLGPGTSRTEYSLEADIVLHSGKKPENNPEAYAARAVIKNLGPIIKRPKSG